MIFTHRNEWMNELFSHHFFFLLLVGPALFWILEWLAEPNGNGSALKYELNEKPLLNDHRGVTTKIGCSHDTKSKLNRGRVADGACGVKEPLPQKGINTPTQRGSHTTENRKKKYSFLFGVFFCALLVWCACVCAKCCLVLSLRGGINGTSVLWQNTIIYTIWMEVRVCVCAMRVAVVAGGRGGGLGGRGTMSGCNAEQWISFSISVWSFSIWCKCIWWR